MFAILKREFKSCFHTFIGFLFVAVNLFFISLYYTIYCLLNGYPYFAYVLSAVVFLFMLSIPILTMRVLAEERKNKTDQLMLTAPVSVFGVVVGKYLAMLSVFAIPNLIACLYPLFTKVWLGSLRGSLFVHTGLLPLWSCLHCNLCICFSTHRKPGDCSRYQLRFLICWLYDDRPVQPDFHHRKLAYNLAQCL